MNRRPTAWDEGVGTNVPRERGDEPMTIVMLSIDLGPLCSPRARG